MSVTAVATWVPISDTLLDDTRFPMGALVSSLLLRKLYADSFGETTIDAMALLERGTARWDDRIWDDDDDDF